MERTPFAGLTRLAPGEALATDNYGLGSRNPAIIDRLLRLAAVAHRHNGEPALVLTPNPPALTASLEAAGGALPADLPLLVSYTALDAQGGETAPGDEELLTTQAGLARPDVAPILQVGQNAGAKLLAGGYTYGVSVTDGTGGESAIGPLAEVVIPPGSSTNYIGISGLADVVASSGGASWRLWRLPDAGRWGLLATGTADAIVDDGTPCIDATLVPPDETTSTSNGTSRLLVTPPSAGVPEAAVALRVYVGVGGAYGAQSLLAEQVGDDIGEQLTLLSVADLLDGSPPDRNLTIPGASQIAASEIAGLPVLAAVPTVGDLPAIDPTGVVRFVVADRKPYLRLNSGWETADVSTGGGGGGLGAVATFDDLPAASGLEEGDARLVLDEGRIYYVKTILGKAWVALTDNEGAGGEGGGETYTYTAPLKNTGGSVSIEVGVGLSVSNGKLVATGGGSGSGGGTPNDGAYLAYRTGRISTGETWRHYFYGDSGQPGVLPPNWGLAAGDGGGYTIPPDSPLIVTQGGEANLLNDGYPSSTGLNADEGMSVDFAGPANPIEFELRDGASNGRRFKTTYDKVTNQLVVRASMEGNPTGGQATTVSVPSSIDLSRARLFIRWVPDTGFISTVEDYDNTNYEFVARATATLTNAQLATAFPGYSPAWVQEQVSSHRVRIRRTGAPVVSMESVANSTHPALPNDVALLWEDGAAELQLWDANAGPPWPQSISLYGDAYDYIGRLGGRYGDGQDTQWSLALGEGLSWEQDDYYGWKIVSTGPTRAEYDALLARVEALENP